MGRHGCGEVSDGMPLPLLRCRFGAAQDHCQSHQPRWTRDSVLNALPEAVQDVVRRRHESGWTPMGRLGTPADVRNAVALLCSEEAGWITGQLIAVDDGASLMDSSLPLIFNSRCYSR